MANNESRKLMVDVVARIDKLEKAMKRGAQVTDQQMGRVEKRAKTMVVRLDQQFNSLAANFGKGFLAGVGAMGVGGIAGAIQNVAKSFADLGREAKMAGVNVEDFQRWRYVADQNRIGIDALTDGFKELSLRASEYVTTAGKSGSAADAFRQLGLSPQEVQERIKDPSKFMLELIDRVQRLKNTAKGIQIFDELFGGQGGEQFVQLIEQGRQGIAATLKEADAMGVVFDKEWIEKSAEIDRSFNRLATTMGTAVKGAIVEAATALEGFISSWRDLESKTLSGVNAELAQLATRKEQLLAQKGTTEDSLLSIIGKDADTEMRSLDDKMAKLQARKDELTATKLDTIVIEPAYKPLAAPTSGKSDAEKSREKAAKQAERERKAVTDLIKELQFEASLVGKTAVQKEQMIAVRHAGAAATAAEKAQIESLVESTYKANEAHEKQKQALEELNDAGRDFAGTLVSGLLDGAKATDLLSNALGQLADRFLNSGLDALFGGGGGIGGIFGSVFGGGKTDPWAGLRGFDSGGYTGPGGVKQPAGVVHKGEVVWSQDDIRRAGGVGTVEAMRRGLAGYDRGGAVSMPSLSAPRMPDLSRITNNNNSTTMNSAPVINVTVNGATGNAEVSAMVQKGLTTGLAEWQRTPQFAMSVGRGVQTARQKGYIR